MEGRIEKKKKRIKKGALEDESESSLPLETSSRTVRKSSAGSVSSIKYNSILPIGFWGAMLTAHVSIS